MSDSASAANLVASSQPVKVETISLPGFAPQNSDNFDVTKFRVRYCKIDLDDPGAVAELEILETKGLEGIDIVILNKQSFTFMDKMFYIVTYLEKKEQTSPSVSVG